MSAIMQGTTPSLTITFSPDDLQLSAVTAIELYVRNGSSLTTYTAADLAIDLDANTITGGGNGGAGPVEKPDRSGKTLGGGCSFRNRQAGFQRRGHGRGWQWLTIVPSRWRRRFLISD